MHHNRRCTRPLAALVLLTACAVSAAAQPQLALPDSAVVFPNDTTFTLVNTHPEPVRFDSLVKSTGFDGQGWVIVSEERFNMPPLIYCEVGGYPPDDNCHATFDMAPGDSILVSVLYGGCLVCRDELGQRAILRGDLPPDTLLIFSGGSTLPARVTIDYNGYISVEAPAHRDAIELTASPNPAASLASVGMSLDRFQPNVRVELVDNLGRLIVTLHDGPLSAGAHGFETDLSSHAPGVYIVRARVGLFATNRRITVVR
jgi:hypothetical protein